MAEKEVARKSDLKAHIDMGWKTAHGIWDAIRSLIPTMGKEALVYKQGTGIIKNPLIIFGGPTTATDETITFEKAFKAGTIPAFSGASDENQCYLTTPTLTNTQVVIRSVSSVNQVVNSSTFTWIAIGESS